MQTLDLLLQTEDCLVAEKESWHWGIWQGSRESVLWTSSCSYVMPVSLLTAGATMVMGSSSYSFVGSVLQQALGISHLAASDGQTWPSCRTVVAVDAVDSGKQGSFNTGH